MAHYHHVWSPKQHTTEAPIVHWTDVAWQWVRAHMPHFKVIAIALSVFLVSYGIVKGYGQFRESAATQLFIQSATNESSPPRSVLEAVADKYPRTAAGKYADWLLATQYYQEGNYKEAVKYYERLAERTSTHRLYHLISSEGKAYSLELEGDYTQAAEIFTRLSKIEENPFAEQDLINAARNQALAGHKEVAKQLLETSKAPAAATQILAMETGFIP